MQTIISQIIAVMLSLVTKTQFKSLADKIFDAIEDWAEGTENKIDDVIVLPLIAKAREILDVPDNDEEDVREEGR